MLQCFQVHYSTVVQVADFSSRLLEADHLFHVSIAQAETKKLRDTYQERNDTFFITDETKNVLKILSDSRTFKNKKSSVLLCSIRSKHLRFFSVVLMGLCCYLNVRIVSFIVPKILQKIQSLSGFEPTTTIFLPTICSTAPPHLVFLYFFCIKNKLKLTMPTKNEDNRQFLHQIQRILTKSTIIEVCT